MILKSEAEAKHEAEAEGSRGQGRSQRLRGRDQNFGLEAKISDALFYHNSLTSPTNCQPTNQQYHDTVYCNMASEHSEWGTYKSNYNFCEEEKVNDEL